MSFWVIQQFKRTESRDTKRYVYICVHNSIIHDSPKVETAPYLSIDRKMDKQNMVYPHNEILFTHIKEWSTDTHYNMAP